MARRKLSALEAFELTMGDAEHLVRVATVLQNERKRGMRKELRERIGDALRIPQRSRAELDCLESNDVFVVIKPGSSVTRDQFRDARPLLRHALVAGCAAFETYLQDKAEAVVGRLLTSSETLTKPLGDLPLTLRDWMEIEEQYQRKGWGLRSYVVEPAVRDLSSTAPNQVGKLLRLLGVEGNWARQVDNLRGVKQGDTVAVLDKITHRRNKITHVGDRVGRGRGQIAVEDVSSYLGSLRSMVAAIERLLG